MLPEDAPLKIKKAAKDHYCDTCHRKIPKGSRYWVKVESWDATKEHTNCEDFKAQPMQEGE